MIKTWILSIALISVSCAFEKTTANTTDLEAGIGILMVDLEAYPQLDFYKDTASNQVTHSCRVVIDKSNNLVIENITSANEWLHPEALWLDYYFFHFRVFQTTDNWYLVCTDNKKQELFWVKKGDFLSYKKWSDFFKEEITNVSKIENIAVEIKTKPDQHATTQKMMEKSDCFEVIQVKGDWIQVKAHTVLECDYSEHKIKSGWIQWRKNNIIQIDYGLTC